MIDLIKQQQVEKIQAEKAAIHPGLVTAFQTMQKLQQDYRQAEEKHLLLKISYEALDREEKLLLYSQPVKKASSKKKTKDFTAQAKNKAIKALDNLPKELREQILANYKGEKL